MNTRTVAALTILLISGWAWATPTTLSYQGQLQQSGATYTGAADFEFRLFDQDTGGAQIGPTVSLTDWPVVDGLFQVELDFGAVFTDQASWLEIVVDGVILTPRQAIRPAPVALYALAGSDWQLNGTNAYYSAGNVGIGTDSPAAPLEIRSDSVIAEPQLLLTEAQDDYARLTLGNTANSRFWTLAGLTRGDTTSQDRLNFYHSALGNLLTLSGSGDGTVGIRTGFPASNYALDVNGGLLVRRDNDGTSLPHLYLYEPDGEEPIRMFWNHAASARLWTLSAAEAASGVESDRFDVNNSGTGNLLSILGNGRTGIGMEPLSRLTVRSDSQWNPLVGDGRGDFYVGDGGVGLSVGVALGGGGRGVTRIWTGGGVEHLFLGSADYGTSLSILPGLVGINNTNPGNTLDIDGGLRVRNFMHADSRPRTVRVDGNGDLISDASSAFHSLPPAAFQPSHDGFDYAFTAGLAVFSGTGSLQAPVHLPEGAIVTEMAVWYTDNSSTTDLSIRLCARALAAIGCRSIAHIVTTGASSSVQMTSDSSPSETIANELNSYFVTVSATDGWAGGASSVHAVRLAYSMP